MPKDIHLAERASHRAELEALDLQYGNQRNDNLEFSKERSNYTNHEENASGNQQFEDHVFKETAKRIIFDNTDLIVGKVIGDLSEKAREVLGLLRKDIYARIYEILPEEDLLDWSQVLMDNVTPTPDDRPPAGVPQPVARPAATGFPDLPKL